MTFIGLLMAVAYSLFTIVWPEKVREWFLRGHNVDAPYLWYKPNTYLTFKPGTLVFRIVGLVMLILALMCLYFWIHSKQAI